jgi:hypothetical protein
LCSQRRVPCFIMPVSSPPSSILILSRFIELYAILNRLIPLLSSVILINFVLETTINLCARVLCYDGSFRFCANLTKLSERSVRSHISATCTQVLQSCTSISHLVSRNRGIRCKTVRIWDAILSLQSLNNNKECYL